MKRLRKCLPVTSLAISFLSILLNPNPSAAEVWRFGSFQIRWLDGFTRRTGSDAIQFYNAEGIGVTVDVMGHERVDLEHEQHMVQDWKKYGYNEMASVAARHGKVVAPVKEEKLSGDQILISISDQEQGSGTPSFGLFYLLISPHGRVAQIVVEGPGTVEQRVAQFRALIDTVQWTESEPLQLEHPR